MTEPRPREYRTSIPEDAVERLELESEAGDARVGYYLGGKLVGYRMTDASGMLVREVGFRAGVPHGHGYDWTDGELTFATSWKNGREHGTSTQWSVAGEVIGSYIMRNGTGIALRWDRREDGSHFLAEVRHYRDGCSHGYEWHINEDEASAWREAHHRDGLKHGIERDWSDRGRLRRGFPKFWVSEEKVTKPQYLKACEDDPSLPDYREQDDLPDREFPPEIVRELSRFPETSG